VTGAKDSEVPPGPSVPAEEESLLRQGWKRCHVAEGPRLQEAVETYEELGFEVTTLPVGPVVGVCAGCAAGSQNLRVIYTRKAGTRGA